MGATDSVAHPPSALPLASTESFVTNRSLRRLAGGAAVAFSLQVFGAGVAYVLQVALAHWMTLVDFGTYNYLLAWAYLLALLAGLGFSSSALRFIAQYRHLQDEARLRGYLRLGRLATVGGGIVAAAIAAPLVLLVFPVRSPQSVYVIVAAVAIVPARALLDFHSAATRAAGGVVRAYLPNLVLRPVGVLAAAAVLWLVRGHISALEAVLVTFAFFGAACGLQSRILTRRLYTQSSVGARAYDWQRWLAVSFPLLLVAGFVIVLTQADLLIIGSIRGAESAGVYSVASNANFLVGYVLVAVSAMTSPLFARLHSAEDQAGMQRVATMAVQWVFWPTLGLAALLGVLAPFVLAVFGPAFSAARLPLTILLAGQLVNAGSGACGWLMSMTGHQGTLARVYGVASVFNLALCYFGARYLGLAGAAAGTTISVMAWNFALVRITRRRLGIRTSILSAYLFERRRHRGRGLDASSADVCCSNDTVSRDHSS